MRSIWEKYGFGILLLYLSAGFFVWPALGVAALICMLAPVIVALKRGREWCGSYCPRGSLWDNVFVKINPRKHVPQWAKSTWFRSFMLLVIFVVFGVQMYYAWPNLDAIGLVFLKIILITTLFGAVLALLYSPRTWCNFCPMGTLASWVSDDKKPLAVANTCVSCKLCAKVCPMQLEPYQAKGSQFIDSDCIKCEECIHACPRKSLSFDEEVS